MILKYSLSIIIILLVTNIGWSGVSSDSLSQDSLLSVMQISDSTKLQSDSISLQTKDKPVLPEFKSIWYDAYGGISYKIDSSAQVIYRFDDLLYLNYNGLGDVFRMHPLVQVYDHMEGGLPRFVAGYNLLPHQTALQINGWAVNDPVHGMYNTRFCPADNIQAVERTPGRSYPAAPGVGLNNGINISTRQLDPVEPYTRIMFRQGDFGHTDLDITFARQLGSRTAIQLNGINKYYDGTSYRGQNYHGLLSYRISRDVQASLRVNINDEDLISYNESKYPSYKYSERRDEVYLDITGVRLQSGQLDWKLMGSASSSHRDVSSQRDTFRVENRYDRYQFAVLKQVDFAGSMKLRTSLSAERTIIWGNAFEKQYIDSRLAGWAALHIPLASNMVITPDVQAHYLWEEDFKLAPGLSFDFTSSHFDFNAAAQEYYRYPYRNERSIKIFGRMGDESLKPERLRNLVAQGKFRLSDRLNFGAEFRREIITNEIRLTDNRFLNGGERSFSVVNASVDFSFYKFRILAGGLHSVADIHLSPENSAYGQIRYTDLWIKGAIKFDAIGGINWIGDHNNIYYDPLAQHYYWTNGNTAGYYFFYFKFVATVKDAQLFIAMDNPTTFEYEYIKGYKEYYRRVQFGLNWVLWD